jgi:hypothetical protein
MIRYRGQLSREHKLRLKFTFCEIEILTKKRRVYISTVFARRPNKNKFSQDFIGIDELYF